MTNTLTSTSKSDKLKKTGKMPKPATSSDTSGRELFLSKQDAPFHPGRRYPFRKEST